MDSREFSAHLEALQLTPADAALELAVSLKTVERWISGKISVPGPVEKAILAWRRLHSLKLSWRPDEEMLIESYEEFQNMINKYDLFCFYPERIDNLMRTIDMENIAPFRVDFGNSIAHLGELSVKFRIKDNGRVSLVSYRRQDRPPNIKIDRNILAQALACIGGKLQKKNAN